MHDRVYISTETILTNLSNKDSILCLLFFEIAYVFINYLEQLCRAAQYLYITYYLVKIFCAFLKIEK